MTTTTARYAFATLAVNAKLHKLLDSMAGQQGVGHEQDVLAFDAHLAAALHQLEQRNDAPLRREVRHAELSLIKRDFNAVEELYRAYKERSQLPETVAERFDRIFSEINEKIRQKELSF